jgi:thiol-disulfide isomerase/thioredoxin
MKKLTILLVWGLLCPYFPSFGQTNNPVKYLKVGDKMPDLLIPNVLNSKQRAIDLAKMRGKVVLIDFWNTYCSSCIDGFSELDSLQNVYPSKLQILLVNAGGDSKRAVDIVIKRTKLWSNNGFNLPIIFPDADVRPYFKFLSVPHTIWINGEGTIIAITGKAEVTPQNILFAIAGKKLNLKEKTD